MISKMFNLAEAIDPIINNIKKYEKVLTTNPIFLFLNYVCFALIPYTINITSLKYF